MRKRCSGRRVCSHQEIQKWSQVSRFQCTIPMACKQSKLGEDFGETQNSIWRTCSTSDSVSSISWNLSLGPLGHDEMCRLWTSMLYAYVRKPRKSSLFLSLDFLGLMHAIGSLDQRYRNHGHPARGKYEPVCASTHLTTRQFPSCNRDKQRCVCLIWHSFFAWISDRARNNCSNQYVRNYINKTGRFAI